MVLCMRLELLKIKNMNDLYNIEFVKGEPFCRCNGEMTTPDWSIKNLGIEGEPEINKDYILCDNAIYIKKNKNNLYFLLEIFGEYKQAPDYDFISNRGYGSTQAYTLKAAYGKGCFVVKNLEYLKNLVIKDFSEFKLDYPNFNKRKYLKFQKSLDIYYENLRKS